MAREFDRYRLWQHDVRLPKKSERTVIVKVSDGEAGVTRAPASVLSAGGRAVRAAGVTPDSGLARLVDNGHVASITNVFADGSARAGRAPSMFTSLGGIARRTATARAPQLVELTLGKGTNPSRLAAHLRGMKGVEYAFVPPVRRLFARKATSADPFASRQWAHGAIRLGHARAAAGFRNATNITVAVVDSGIDRRHPDLKPAIGGYRNFIGGSDRDYVGHGTHVAGIIAAAAGNRLGISGVCGGRILALKVLPRDGEEFDATAYYRALRYVIGRAQVLNLSLGGEKDPAEIDVLRDVIAAGVVVVAAMGNEYDEGNPIEYPAAIPEVCAVGASDQLDTRAGFSNTGRHIDLLAPGVSILSATPTFRYDGDGEEDYDAWDGTSMATPHVAGAAALVLAKWPTLTPAQVIRKLTSSADRIAGAKRGSAAYGAGRLNCQRALR